MADTKKSTPERRFEVLVSFDGLDKGDRFTATLDAWANTHVENGYLKDVTEEGPDAGGDVGKG